MPNWCLNIIWFRGMPEQMRKLRELFEVMAAHYIVDKKGQLPDFIFSDTGHFYDISCGGDVFEYLTMWNINADVLKQIADHYGLDFSCTYDEPGNCIFGELVYKGGVFTGIELDDADFSKYEYEEESETYLFEGQRYGKSADIKEILLQRKKEGL